MTLSVVSHSVPVLVQCSSDGLSESQRCLQLGLSVTGPSYHKTDKPRLYWRVTARSLGLTVFLFNHPAYPRGTGVMRAQFLPCWSLEPSSFPQLVQRSREPLKVSGSIPQVSPATVLVGRFSGVLGVFKGFIIMWTERFRYPHPSTVGFINVTCHNRTVAKSNEETYVKDPEKHRVLFKKAITAYRKSLLGHSGLPYANLGPLLGHEDWAVWNCGLGQKDPDPTTLSAEDKMHAPGALIQATADGKGPGQNHLSTAVSLWPHFYEELDFLSSVFLQHFRTYLTHNYLFNVSLLHCKICESRSCVYVHNCISRTLAQDAHVFIDQLIDN
ncbi:hypothetical protein MG293_010794 [Ovis ammon polii]|uniref:Uncharacterized protein n=1 Tax=Ovis ammon polii TaxID=230172 RepID=A0AAD4U3V4_OVIAM|nr:hypothetical protein MG293_010794 [Ovis ammon polii]